MRSPEDLAFILRRVRAEIRANPPQGPLLTEVYGAPREAPPETCRDGHPIVRKPSGGRYCPTCDRERKRASRAQGVNW